MLTGIRCCIPYSSGGAGVEWDGQAAVSESLPVSVLLGTDVPELGQLLQSNPRAVDTEEVERVLVVTRAQSRRDEEEERERVSRDEQSGVRPNSLEAETPNIQEMEAEEEILPGEVHGTWLHIF